MLCYIHVLISNVYGFHPAVLLWVLSLPSPVSYSTFLIVDGEISFSHEMIVVSFDSDHFSCKRERIPNLKARLNTFRED